MSETHTTVNSLHSDSVLFVLVEFAKNIEQLCLRNFRDQFDHFIQNNGRLFTHLGSFVLRQLVIHVHDFLLV